MGNSATRAEQLELCRGSEVNENITRIVGMNTDKSKIEKNLSKYSRAELKSKYLVILLLSGSFNPIHKMHYDMLEITKKYLEKKFGDDIIVIGGYLATSSDGHVRSKVGDNLAITLHHRNELLKIVTEESDWISWCGLGNPSGYFTLMVILSLLNLKFKDYLKQMNNSDEKEKEQEKEYTKSTNVLVSDNSRDVNNDDDELEFYGLEVCGSDLGQKFPDLAKRSIVCVERIGHNSRMLEAIQSNTASPHFIYIDCSHDNRIHIPISSTKIRRYLTLFNTEEEEDLIEESLDDGIHPDVLEYMKINEDKLFYSKTNVND